MKRVAPSNVSFCLAIALAGLTGTALANPNDKSISITPVVSLASTPVTGAEIGAYDKNSGRLFVTTGGAGKIDIFSIKPIESASKVGSIDITPYGPVANSVAVHNGLVAAAIEADTKTDNGSVVFFDVNGNFKGEVEVGALPDMLTFTKDGKTLLVANEAEPNQDYTVDPEGSVSIIDLKKGPDKATVKTAGFGAFDKATLVAAGIRIFGPGATAAQDLEPEFITVSNNQQTAWVTLQENNAVATIDIKAAKVTAIRALGYKDHNVLETHTDIYPFDMAKLPPIGTTAAGQELPLGGFSGLHFEGVDPQTCRYKFVTHTDRGPNADSNGVFRPFLLPDFAPEVVRFELDPKNGKIQITQRLPLQKAPGVPLTGLPNTAIAGGDGSTPYNDEVPVDLLGNVLPLDPLGADLEGIVTDPADGSFWMADEYRPAIYHFDSAGVLIDRFIPIGTAAAAGAAPGTFGTEALPAVLAQRRQNRGFEAVALSEGKVYAFVQSPLRNPTTLSNGALNGMKNIRLVEFDPATHATRMFIYVMDNPNDPALGSRPDKIGDAVAVRAGEFLVVERDDDSVLNAAPNQIEKKVYHINLAGATDVSGMDGPIGGTGKTVDQLTAAELVANGINPIPKDLHVDLNAAGYNAVEKVEGLTIIDLFKIAVINDNDFGVANITVNPDGTFTPNAPAEPTQLGIIDVKSNGLDASDRDGKINIRRWPVRGLFMPDAIASFQYEGKNYLVTANEGDARVYPTEDIPGGLDEGDAFNEEVRIGSSSVVLEPTVFPNAAILKNNANLGRLTITNTMGKNAAGRYEALYAFGARSFSIWNEDLDLIYDSGDALEQITATAFPADFNSNNDENDSFESRSDNKGPEPEGVAIGDVGGRTYAFIGLERIGGVVVCDVSEPSHPRILQYVNNRDFTAADPADAGDLGPEGILFIPGSESPTQKPLLVVTNEVSGTTTVYRIDEGK